MIQTFIVKRLVDAAFKNFMKNREMKNLRKYVEEDNELDLQVRAHAKAIDKYGKYIEELEKDVATLKVKLKKLDKRRK
jgi:hypothetical protein|tara:strand:- start:118 stop:351 length:234 start_codon:yes stop_codon:yes gene_type:complete